MCVCFVCAFEGIEKAGEPNYTRESRERERAVPGLKRNFKAQPVAFSALSPSHLFGLVPTCLLISAEVSATHTSSLKTKKNHKGRR